MTNFEKQSYRYQKLSKNELLEIIVKLETEVWNCSKLEYIKELERKIARLEKRTQSIYQQLLDKTQ